MKTISHVLLLVIAIATLAACGESGTGPSKPNQLLQHKNPQNKSFYL